MLQRSLPNVRPSMIMAGMCLAFLPSALSFQSNGMALRPFETMLRGACQRRSVKPSLSKRLSAVTKAEFTQVCKSGPKNGVGSPESLVDQVRTMSEALVSPTSKIATSAIVDGKWRLIFTTTSGSSGGKLGPFVGDVYQDIRYRDGKYYNILQLGPVEAVLSAHWDVLDDNKWAVTFDDIKFSVFGLKVVDKEFGPAREQTLETLDTLAGGSAVERSSTNGGYWDLRYADDTLRILYAYGTGKDPTKANIFVLEKVLS